MNGLLSWLGCSLACSLLAACALPVEREGDGPIEQQTEAITRAPQTSEVPWSVQIDACSGALLTPRWVLTAAHCYLNDDGVLPPEIAPHTVQTVDPSTGNKVSLYSGSGRLFLHPDYVPLGPRLHDVALIELFGDAVLPSNAGYAALYDDAREPWAPGYLGNRQFDVAGYGHGTDPGGLQLCEDVEHIPSTFGTKRFGTELELNGQNQIANGVRVKTTAVYTGDQELCDGDSGAPWTLRRGGMRMEFAVHSGNRGAIVGNKAATLIEPKITFILNGRPIDCRHDYRDGFRFLACQDSHVKLWREAESAALTAPMVVGRSGNASRSRHAWIPPGSADGGKMTFTVSSPVDAGYWLWLRASAPSASAQRIRVTMDGAANEPTFVVTLPITGSAFRWTQVTAVSNVPANYPLSVGTHTIVLRPGHQGVKVDRILLTDDRNFVPFDTFIEAESGALTAPMQFVSNTSGGTIDLTTYGSGYIRVPPGAGSGASASYGFDTATRSNYVVWARTSQPLNDGVGFHATLDAASYVDDWIWHVPSAPSWAWNPIFGTGRGALDVILDVGHHAFALKRNVTGGAIDRVFITNDPSFVPADVELAQFPDSGSTF